MEKKTLHKKVPLWRKAVEILGTALLCGLIAFLICHFMITPQYQATASMEVSFAHLPGAFYTSFETGVEVDLAKEYAGLFQLDSTRYNAAGAAGIDVAEIDKNISVSAVPGTQTMYFKASFPNPEQAQAAANAYMKAFDGTLKDNTGYDDENLLLEAQLPTSPASPKTGIVTIVTVLIAGMIAFAIFSRQPLFDSINVLFFLVFTIICIFPFYYLFINTISDNDMVSRGLVNFFPVGIHFSNYISLQNVSDLGSSILVTVARTILGTALMVIVSAWAGYLVTKQKMWKRSFWYRALVITMYFNAGLVPWYMNMLMLGLTDNFLAYILPGMVAPYNIILVKTYIESIPASLEESAVIDGASTPKVFVSIIWPLSIPILATIAIFGAVGNWNSFQDSLLLMSNKPQLYTLQHRLYIYLNTYSNLGAAMSSSGGVSNTAIQNMLNTKVVKYTISMVTIIPILMVYPIMQRYFVKGIMLGAVKG